LDAIVKSYLVKNNCKNRYAKLQAQPSGLPYVGLKDIKMLELWSKFRFYIPEAYWADICPKPPDSVLNNIKSELAKKAKASLAKKRKLLDEAEARKNIRTNTDIPDNL
jgi:hypothetical protein